MRIHRLSKKVEERGQKEADLFYTIRSSEDTTEILKICQGICEYYGGGINYEMGRYLRGGDIKKEMNHWIFSANQDDVNGNSQTLSSLSSL